MIVDLWAIFAVTETRPSPFPLSAVNLHLCIHAICYPCIIILMIRGTHCVRASYGLMATGVLRLFIYEIFVRGLDVGTYKCIYDCKMTYAIVRRLMRLLPSR